MTPLERAIAAIADVRGPTLDKHITRSEREKIARAVLQAIREPSSPMVRQAKSESHVAGDCEVDYIGIWASMIDAALEEG